MIKKNTTQKNNQPTPNKPQNYTGGRNEALNYRREEWFGETMHVGNVQRKGEEDAVPRE